MKVPKTFRIDPEILKKLNTFCASQDRTYTWVIEKALVAYIGGAGGAQTKQVATVAKNATVEVVAKKESKPREKFDASEVDYIGLNRSAWLEWCEYRKSKRKAISKAAAKKQTNLLLAYDEQTQKQMIDSSIANDYQGIFEPKASFNGGGTQFKTAQEKRAERNGDIYDYEKATTF